MALAIDNLGCATQTTLNPRVLDVWVFRRVSEVFGMIMYGSSSGIVTAFVVPSGAI